MSECESRLRLSAPRESSSRVSASGIRPWDRAALVAEIRKLERSETRVSSMRVKEVHPELQRAAIRLVGNWTTALRLAGLDPEVHREPHVWTNEKARAWVREAHRAGHSVRSTDAPPGVLAHVSSKLGLRWADLVESLGIRYPGGRRRLDWTDENVLEEIRARHRGGRPMYHSAAKRECQALLVQARGRYGSWSAAVQRAGLEPQRLTRRWTRETMLAKLRARRRRRQPLDRVQAKHDDESFVRSVGTMFGSWDRALTAAGISRDAPRRSHAQGD